MTPKLKEPMQYTQRDFPVYLKFDNNERYCSQFAVLDSLARDENKKQYTATWRTQEFVFYHGITTVRAIKVGFHDHYMSPDLCAILLDHEWTVGNRTLKDQETYLTTTRDIN